MLRARGGTWIGWSGLPREEIAADAALALPDAPGVRYVDVPLTSHELSAYYHGFSNRTLWPLFHYFVGRTEIDGANWRVYDRVNERFAAATATALGDREAMVWIHDYQLLRAPHHLRRLAPQASLAFFLHVPFPAVDVYRLLPWSRELLRGMLASDHVGFHIHRYATNFLDSAEELLGCTVDRDRQLVHFDGRAVGVGVHPISIDVDEAVRLTAQVPRQPNATRQILGVDRLDYTKGVIERLDAIERLLERYPSYRRRIRFTQVLVPSREHVRTYAELKREIDERVGRINGRFSEDGWTPIRYFARSLDRAELFAAYRGADVALVTPLRDGMNLVAKEYVMSQPEGDGVLVLSELAGAADELQEALMVTPFDPDAVATALHRALSMPADERRARMAALRAHVRTHDVHAWVEGFLRAADVATQRPPQAAEPRSRAVRGRLAPWLAERSRVALLLDYDGTLTPIVDHPDRAVLSPETRAVLEDARRNPAVDLILVTGRGLDDIRAKVDIAGITYVASHGFEIVGPGITWRHGAAARWEAVVGETAAELEALRVAGALVERKRYTVAFHYRGVDPAARSAARAAAEAVLRKRRLKVTDGKLVAEGRPPIAWDKGSAVLWVLAQRHGADWPAHLRALYIGDDVTDEDAFRALHGLGRSIRVGDPRTLAESAADEFLPDPDAVRDLLRWCASGASSGQRE